MILTSYCSILLLFITKQLGNLDIGDGFILKVSLADYDLKGTIDIAHTIGENGDVTMLSSVSNTTTVSGHSHGNSHNDKSSKKLLPPECESNIYPVVLICNAYTSSDIAQGGDDFLSELEVR